MNVEQITVRPEAYAKMVCYQTSMKNSKSITSLVSPDIYYTESMESEFLTKLLDPGVLE